MGEKQIYKNNHSRGFKSTVSGILIRPFTVMLVDRLRIYYLTGCVEKRPNLHFSTVGFEDNEEYVRLCVLEAMERCRLTAAKVFLDRVTAAVIEAARPDDGAVEWGYRC